MSGTRKTDASHTARSKPLFAALALSGFGLFVAAPTPGNVGGCGGANASRPIQPGNLEANPPETPEYLYFDRGLCGHMCTRLIQCRSLCTSLSNPPEICRNPDGSTNETAIYEPQNASQLAQAFATCTRERGGIRDFVEQGNNASQPVFGLAQCPHACPCGMRDNYAPVEWDVQTCGDAVLSLSCDQLNTSGTVFGAFTNAPPECLSACKPCR